jgi:hypothetical protein
MSHEKVIAPNKRLQPTASLACARFAAAEAQAVMRNAY